MFRKSSPIFAPDQNLLTMKTAIYSMAALWLLVACTHDIPGINGAGSGGYEGLSHEMIVLGEKLDDPYTVGNMTKALESLYPTKAVIGTVKTTDYYVRFLPKSEHQCEMLEEMGVVLVDHPVDYRIVRDGDYYHDPELPDDSITWQYAVVPQGFEFPEFVQYEILDECFIAEHDQTTKASGIDWDAVERESYRLTGNAAMLPPGTKGGYPPTYPKGNISIADDEAGMATEGVAGVRVSCNSFVKFAHSFTDENGDYKMNLSFTSDVRYRLVFKNKKGFAIGFNLLLVPASTSTLGKGSPDGVSVVIDSNSDRKLFTRAVVNNAGYEYYTKCSEDGYRMKAPPSNLRIWLFQNLTKSCPLMMQQGALIDGSFVQDYLKEYIILLKLFLPDVAIGLKDCGSFSDVYGEAIHEFAHASHYMQAGKEYWNTYLRYVLSSYVTSGGQMYGVGTEDGCGYCEVAEMWAFYMHSKMCRDRYSDDGLTYGTEYWFSPQPLLFLDDRGMDKFKLFKAFSSDVADKDALQDRLIFLYPENKSTINQAFNRYN